ncbi:MAG: SagB/ThcOx family dehydrogenase [Syntrophotaleaceae bacterium]
MSRKSGREFMEQTKHKYMSPSDQQRNLPQPPLTWPGQEDRANIDLPAPAGLVVKPVDMLEVITRRVSHRDYADVPLSLLELSYLLWCTQGVKKVYADYMTLRTVPSAGARHAFETVLLVNRVEDLEPGVYRYLAIGHRLELVSTLPDFAERFTAACYDQRFIADCGVTFLWVAVPYRMTWRYSERGYRYLHLDAGHVCQNLYLAAEAIGAGVCAVAAFNDEELNSLLGLDPEEAFVIYLAAVGKLLQ